MTNETKKEIAAFMRDYQEMCAKTDCDKCPMNGYPCGLNETYINPARAIAAVEAWRESRKPKPEVIDRSLDVYTIEVQKVRECPEFNVDEYSAMNDVIGHFERFGYTITDFKAKRFVLESHREEAKK